MRIDLGIVLLITGLGCRSPVLDLAPDALRTGDDGTDGPFGVAHQTFTAQARATDVVRYEVSWPARADGDFDDTSGRCAVVAFIQGGLVQPGQYRWLHRHLSSRGYCVVAPEHALQLAILESDNASVALDDLQQHPRGPLENAIGERAVVMGHSRSSKQAPTPWGSQRTWGPTPTGRTLPSMSASRRRS